MNKDDDKQPASAPEQSNEDADKVSKDDRHKTEKLARHDGVDPNAGQE